jgi:SnoaL-like domain
VTDDYAAIRELITDYALALDAGDIDGCTQLFTADAEVKVYGRSFVRHEGLRKMFADAPHGLHLTGVSRIDIHGDTATARSQVLFVRAGDLQLRPGLYDDELIRDGERWRFRRRRCQFITSGGLSDRPEVVS